MTVSTGLFRSSAMELIIAKLTDGALKGTLCSGTILLIALLVLLLFGAIPALAP